MKEQIIQEGWNSLEKIGTLLERVGCSRVLLVTGKRSFAESPGRDCIFEALSGKSYEVFNDFQINPKYEDAQKGLDLFRSFRPDVIVAMGGGTVLDMAKLINALSSLSDDPVPYIRGAKKLSGVSLPLIAVPTTSGTGSEATHFAVVYLEGEKYSLAHQAMLPDSVILDPGLTMDMPPYLTACTGMDALCQGIESYWSVNSTEESRACSRRAVELAAGSLKQAVHSPRRDSREAMQQAAYFAGKGINIAKTTAAHAFSYHLTSKYAIPHGQAVGLLMGWVFQNNLGVNEQNCIDPRGVDFVKSRLEDLCEILGIPSHRDAAGYFDRLLKDLNLDQTAFVLNQESREELFQVVNRERLSNNPVEMEQG